MSKEYDFSYPVTICRVPEDMGGGLHAYLTDFGHSACSAVGDTVEETLELLQEVKTNVIAHYKEWGMTLPESSPSPVCYACSECGKSIPVVGVTCGECIKAERRQAGTPGQPCGWDSQVRHLKIWSQR